MRKIVTKPVTLAAKSIVDLRVSRRIFIKRTTALGFISICGSSLLQSCVNSDQDELLSKPKEKILISIQNILFPKDHNGPGAYDFLAHEYVKWYLKDNRIDPDERKYILNGLQWVDESAQETKQKRYLKLDKKEQVDLVYNIATESWGDSWLSAILSLIFEAMISDPIYGFNNNEIGRKWLNFQAGFPRPTQALKYDTIFTTLHKNDHYE